MSNEEQIADTIEMLYERLNGYNKQDLFNYGYLLESNQILCKDIEEKDKEIERLNNIIDELEEELEREINFGKTIPKEADNYNSSLDIRHTLEKVLERLKALKEGKENERKI